MIKKILIIAAFITTIFNGCKKDSSAGPQQGKDDAAFSIYENSFLEGLWKLNPDWAASAGYHKYDSLLLVPDDKSRDKLLNFAKVQIDSLSRFDQNILSESNRVDYHMMQNQMESVEWNIQQLRAYQWDPTYYNVCAAFACVLNGHTAPLAKRLRNFYQKMANIPAYYKEAEKQIKNPAVELTDLAAEQSLGGLGVFEKDFADSLKKANIPQTEQKQMLDRAHTTADAVKAFAGWLKALKNDKPRSFRLGKELYEAKFKYDIQSELAAQQMYNAAMERKKNLHHEMAKISRQLWPKYFGTKPQPADSLDLIAQMIDTLSSKHIQPNELQSAIGSEIPKVTAFAKAKDIAAIDPAKPLLLRKEPGYMEGLADVSMTAPGPYDKDGNTYLNLGSPDGRGYNQYTLQLLCIHEAIPGHYLEQVYAYKAPGLIKSVFGNNAMIEGWAAYSEELMLDNGFGGNEPEMKLMWYNWHLRFVCNAILDYKVHVENMAKQDALKLMTREAFEQQAEAEEKWKHATLTSVQSDSYFAGYKDIIDLREAYKKKMGDKYKPKEFNEKFLNYGSAPVRYIKEIMLAKGSGQ